MRKKSSPEIPKIEPSEVKEAPPIEVLRGPREKPSVEKDKDLEKVREELSSAPPGSLEEKGETATSPSSLSEEKAGELIAGSLQENEEDLFELENGIGQGK